MVPSGLLLSNVSFPVTNRFHDQFSQCLDGNLFARTDVDVWAGIFEIHLLHNEYRSIGHLSLQRNSRNGVPVPQSSTPLSLMPYFFRMLRISSGCTVRLHLPPGGGSGLWAPPPNSLFFRQWARWIFRIMAGQHVAAFQVEVIMRTVQVSGHHGNVIGAVLQIGSSHIFSPAIWRWRHGSLVCSSGAVNSSVSLSGWWASRG